MDLVPKRFHNREPGFIMVKRFYGDNHKKPDGWTALLSTQKNVNNSSEKWNVSWTRRVRNYKKNLAQRMRTETEWSVDFQTLMLLKHRAKTVKELIGRTNLNAPSKHSDRVPMFPHYGRAHQIPLKCKYSGTDKWPVATNYCRHRAITNATHNIWMGKAFDMAWGWVHGTGMHAVLPNLVRLTDISPKSYRRGKLLDMCQQLERTPESTRSWFIKLCNVKFRWSTDHMHEVYLAWKGNNLLTFMARFDAIECLYQPRKTG